jgi:hypothetical protein
MGWILWAAAVGAAFGLGLWAGKWLTRRMIAAAIGAGRSPKARALRAVMTDKSLSLENDR